MIFIGKPMLGKVKERIFDYLFTTKGVVKGTKSGLAIAWQIYCGEKWEKFRSGI